MEKTETKDYMQEEEHYPVDLLQARPYVRCLKKLQAHSGSRAEARGLVSATNGCDATWKNIKQQTADARVMGVAAAQGGCGHPELLPLRRTDVDSGSAPSHTEGDQLRRPLRQTNGRMSLTLAAVPSFRPYRCRAPW